MEESVVREHAQAHADAMVAGDLARAGGDLTPEAQEAAAGVMRELPRPVETAELVRVEAAGDDGFVSHIRYGGGGKTVTVEARWADQGGRPRIVGLALGRS